MLGIRLKPDEEDMLARHARRLGRPKSAVAREWIVERLERESADVMIARIASRISEREVGRTGNADSVLAALDQIDGGYDWGPHGPPT